MRHEQMLRVRKHKSSLYIQFSHHSSNGVSFPHFFSEHSAWVLSYSFPFFFFSLQIPFESVLSFWGLMTDWIVTNGCLSLMGWLIRLARILFFFFSSCGQCIHIVLNGYSKQLSLVACTYSRIGGTDLCLLKLALKMGFCFFTGTRGL